MIKYPDTIKVYDNFLEDDVINYFHRKLGEDLVPNDFHLRRTGVTADGKTVVHSKTPWNLHGESIPPPPPTQEMLAYNFLSTNDHDETCKCSYCELLQIFDSRRRTMPELKDLSLDDSYLSLYRAGDFLNRHHDGQHVRNYRKWAFTLTLTKDWLPDYGGILNVQDPECGNWYAFPPVFNRLILLDVSLQEEKVGMTHFVTHVHPNVTINRLTYSGWYGIPL